LFLLVPACSCRNKQEEAGTSRDRQEQAGNKQDNGKAGISQTKQELAVTCITEQAGTRR